jgi:hypothetical protein
MSLLKTKSRKKNESWKSETRAMRSLFTYGGTSTSLSRTALDSKNAATSLCALISLLGMNQCFRPWSSKQPIKNAHMRNSMAWWANGCASSTACGPIFSNPPSLINTTLSTAASRTKSALSHNFSRISLPRMRWAGMSYRLSESTKMIQLLVLESSSKSSSWTSHKQLE